MRWIVIECILLIERILVTTKAKMNSELLCYYLVLLFRECVFGTSLSTLSLFRRAFSRSQWKKKINARLMVVCRFSSLHLILTPCAKINVHIKRFNIMFDAIVLYSGENIPFDSCESAQMKHMHVNEHFRIIPKLTKNEAFVFFFVSRKWNKWRMSERNESRLCNRFGFKQRVFCATFSCIICVYVYLEV